MRNLSLLLHSHLSESLHRRERNALGHNDLTCSDRQLSKHLNQQKISSANLRRFLSRLTFNGLKDRVPTKSSTCTKTDEGFDGTGMEDVKINLV
jgi:hypothetical protein